MFIVLCSVTCYCKDNNYILHHSTQYIKKPILHYISLFAHIIYYHKDNAYYQFDERQTRSSIQKYHESSNFTQHLNQWE